MKPSIPQHYYNCLGYLKGSWRLEETCCHSNSREKPLVKVGVKNSSWKKKRKKKRCLIWETHKRRYIQNLNEKKPKNIRFSFILMILYWLMSRVFANGPEDRGSILGRVILKTQKMVIDATLLNTQHYKVRIKGKVEQSREWSCALPYSSVM